MVYPFHTLHETPIKLHGFGIGVSQLIEGELYSILDSADSQDYSIRGRYLDEHQNGQINRFTAVSNAYTSKKIKLMKELKANISQNHTQSLIIDSLEENRKTRIEKTNDLIRTVNSLKQDLIEKNIYKNEQHLLCKECLYSNDRPDNLLYCPVFEHECPYSEF